LGYDATEIEQKAGWQVFVCRRYEADMTRALQDGDQVRIFPPVAAVSARLWGGLQALAPPVGTQGCTP
jgi:hypothetical protein